MSVTKTSIAWTDSTWGVTRGCSEVGPECERCYAKSMASRFSGPGLPYEGLAKRSEKRGLPQWTGEVRFVREMLDQPLRWRKPRRIFVNSMSDLFHEKLSNEEIAAVFGVMAAAPRHIFQILTKRPARAVEWFRWVGGGGADKCVCFADDALMRLSRADRAHWFAPGRGASSWPLPNVHLYVSAGTQKSADDFIPLLLQIPAAVRGVSAEPLLEAVDLSPWLGAAKVAHVLIGGESGRGARPFHVDWARSLLKQCSEAGVAAFMKQLGSNARDRISTAMDWPLVDARFHGLPNSGDDMVIFTRDKKGGDMAEWPEDLRVRQMPEGQP